MNKRIRELAKEAELLVHNPENVPTKLEKFAMLILQDCIDQCENVGTVIDAMHEGEEARRFKAVADNCARMIRLRFGVKP
jgi:hypothetical protein